ncbi:MAG: hypothetical protein E6K60_00635 [Nitrospirae bacterium]|nr:MAG: hypothetical protein E6K60_00635 [Nitrospirota bacterium]
MRGEAVIFFYLLISVMPLVQHPFWSHFVGTLTMTKIVGVVCLVYAVLHVSLRPRSLRFFQTSQARWFAALCLIAALSYVAKNQASEWEVSPLMSYVSFFLLFLLTLALVDSLVRLRWVLLVAIGSMGLASLYVLREWQKFHNVYREFRPGFVTGDPNYFSVSALLCLPLAFYLIRGRPKWERWFCIGCIALTLLALTAAASRGALVALIVMALIMAWRSRQRAGGLLLVGAFAIFISVVSPAAPVERILNPTHGDIQSTDTRKAVWAAGMRMIAENPVVGIGLGNFKPLVSQYAEPGQRLDKIAHNTYIEMAAELGLVGLVVFVVILFGTIHQLGEIRRRTQLAGPLLIYEASQGMQLGLIAYAIACFFVSVQYQKLFWLMIFLTMCLPLLERASKAQPVQDRPRWSWATLRPIWASPQAAHAPLPGHTRMPFGPPGKV